MSQFTGGAELTDTILTNPYAISEFAGKIKEAIEMPETERQRRIKNRRAIVASNNIYRWGADTVSRLISLMGV